jgi:glycosyltransferase involved in cell wall biosynthesis
VPRVSIGLTVFNSERYLDESIQSLLSQTFQDFELIISDNASTDRTKDIALTYAARDHRVRYVRNRMNIGVAGNFNQVFRLSSGEFFKWAAYDDLCAPDFLFRCVEVLDRDRAVVLAYPRTAGIDEHGRATLPHAPGPDLTSGDPAVRFAHIMQAPFWATSLFGLIRADVMSRTGLMPSNAAGDHVLLAELSLHGRFCEIPGEGFLNRDHPGRAFVKSSIITRAQQVDPRLGRNPFLLRLTQIGSYVAVIRRAPLDRRARLRCYRAVARWLGDRITARTLGPQRRLSPGKDSSQVS